MVVYLFVLVTKPQCLKVQIKFLFVYDNKFRFNTQDLCRKFHFTPKTYNMGKQNFTYLLSIIKFSSYMQL